ncbi:type III secretion system export apparatus subunit SctT [Sinorhizobium sp. 7-81]|uniref:type III secretion system export apparatus subunit SctT n=1 Tax=unclassified Sinorhizobium TaxID=2613772 RepID=UPI0024C39902|nr:MULTISPECIES: type III secretion system export apparatus subunit SctT [unclassified Sinorhizobium]MDK1389345.1 type III secretion system export apparatus subunit SctT [Sinorhizobium sp. 7-81]MDK1492987.1 type III secretion system export apparatus subunit SctT [Sinorhizobium sp. 8-89]
MSPLDPTQLHMALVVFALAMARTSGMMLITPIFGRGIITGLTRNGIIISWALPVIAYAWRTKPTNLDVMYLSPILGLCLKELVVGLLLGMPVATIVWGVEAAGTFIDNQRGATMASLLNRATGNQASPLGALLAQLYVTWLFVTGGFSTVIAILYGSYDIWPLWRFQPAFGPAFVTEILRLADVVMLLTLLLAGPAIVAMFLSELGLALISRFAPQLQVFFLAMPVKSAVGLFLLILSLTNVLITADKHVPSAVVIFNHVVK